MGGQDETTPRRRGRPRDTKSSETRRILFDGARALFAERGYSAVTNKDLAAAAGITTGAMYHYVESKLDLYVAVHNDIRRQIYGRFQVADAAQSTFIGKFESVLDAARVMNQEDPSLARFTGTVRADLRRHPELAERLGDAQKMQDDFFLNIVECGVATGEIQREDVDLVRRFIQLILIGLTEGSSHTPEAHRLAIDSVIGMVRGTLVSAPNASASRSGS